MDGGAHQADSSGQEVPSSSFLCSSPLHLSLRACHGILTGSYPFSAVCLAPMMGSSLPPREAAGGPVGNYPERTGQEGREWDPGSALNTQGLGLSQMARPRALAPGSMVRLEGSPYCQECILVISDSSKEFGRWGRNSLIFKTFSKPPPSQC